MEWLRRKTGLGVALLAAAMLTVGCGNDDDDDSNNPADSNEPGDFSSLLDDIDVESLEACTNEQLAVGNAVFEAISVAFEGVSENAFTGQETTVTVDGENGGTATITVKPLGVNTTTGLVTGATFTIQFNDFGLSPEFADVNFSEIDGTATGEIGAGGLGTSFGSAYTAKVTLDDTTEVELVIVIEGFQQTVVFTIDGQSCNLLAFGE